MRKPEAVTVEKIGSKLKIPLRTIDDGYHKTDKQLLILRRKL